VVRQVLKITVMINLATALAVGALELSVVDAGSRRAGLVEAVDNRGDAAAAERATTALFEAFTDGNPSRLVWSDGVEPVWGPTVPDVPPAWFGPFLERASEYGAAATIFLFLQPEDRWRLYLVGADGEVFEERTLVGSYDDVMPRLTAIAVSAFHGRFPIAIEVGVRHGRLRVTCDQPGYSISVDGSSGGLVPSEGIEFVLTPGRHSLVLYDDSGEAVRTRSVAILPDETTWASFNVGPSYEEDDDYDGPNLMGCLFDAFFSALCGSNDNGGDDDDDDDDDDIWGPDRDDDDDDDDDDDKADSPGSSIWGPG